MDRTKDTSKSFGRKRLWDRERPGKENVAEIKYGGGIVFRRDRVGNDVSRTHDRGSDGIWRIEI
jgi:hypothetical protein